MEKQSILGGELLRQWLDDERRPQQWLAEQIGTHQTNVSRWIRGDAIPLRMAVAIRDVTGIAVEAWLHSDESSQRLIVDAAKSG